jgi:hypothetical protein
MPDCPAGENEEPRGVLAGGELGFEKRLRTWDIFCRPIQNSGRYALDAPISFAMFSLSAEESGS